MDARESGREDNWLDDRSKAVCTCVQDGQAHEPITTGMSGKLTCDGSEFLCEFWCEFLESIASQRDARQLHTFQDEEHGVRKLPQVTAVQFQLLRLLGFLAALGNTRRLRGHGNLTGRLGTRHLSSLVPRLSLSAQKR